MSKLPDALWVNVSPSFGQFDCRLLDVLSQNMPIAKWQYSQTQDEATSLSVALNLLHHYIKQFDRPIHLLGHSTGGLLALLYARSYPKRVKSLTLLSVGVFPAVDWQAHYYIQRQLLPCSREVVLTQTIDNLFGRSHSASMKQNFVEILEQDLQQSLSPHSIYERSNIAPIKVSVPLLVCGSRDDVVVDQNLIYKWQPYLKKGDRIWQCPSGGYFFHHYYSQLVSEQILDFWTCSGLSTDSPISFNNIYQSFLNKIINK